MDEQISLDLLTLNNILTVGLFVFALLGFFFMMRFFIRKATEERDNFLKSLYRHMIRPLSFLFFLTALSLTVQQVEVPYSDHPAFGRFFTIATVIAFAWLAIRGVYFASEQILRRFDVDKKDNLNARMIHTQIRVLRRLVLAMVIILAIGAALMSFEEIRSLGVSLLASAGVAGIVLGLAAQKTLGNFFTGLQIAITQPIRLGDAVVVEGEWGWIEEINLTYVVIKIWDWRRLVLPISYFTDHPFQNWTRHTAEMLGSVVFYFDYGMPMEPIREELDRILEKTDLWNGRVKVVQVMDTTEKSMVVRILVTADDSPTSWDLRCFVRENMLLFIQQNYPEYMPRVRAEIEGEEYFKPTKEEQPHAA